MPLPSITIQHLKTSKQYDGSRLIHRYWFQWSNRRNLSATVVRLELFDVDGAVITSASIKLPKVKITGYAPKTDTEPEKPIYDSTVWIQLDDVVRDALPVQFRYYTVNGLLSKSETVTGEMSGKYEDISYLG